MTLTTISIIVATAIYVAYNAVSLAYFGVPESLSNTYYLYKEKSNKGYLFCIMMYLVVAFMMPAWISMSEGSDFQFLAFLAPSAIAFVGTAPAFKSDSLENVVHSTAAIVAALCSLLWVAIITPYWWVILMYAGLYIGLALMSNSLRPCLVYWLEQVAFGATFTSAIMYSL